MRSTVLHISPDTLRWAQWVLSYAFNSVSRTLSQGVTCGLGSQDAPGNHSGA
ncbi:hypothetical protein GCM10010447_49750 [Streptomyces fulvorobeus]